MATNNALNNASSNGFTITSGNLYTPGLTFDGSNVISAYIDKQSWTPTLTFGGGSTGLTYTTQLGTYSRIGSLVFVACTIILSAKGSSVGNATITGLPVTPAADYIPVAMRSSALTYANQINATFSNSQNAIILFNQVSAGAQTQITDTAFADTTALRFTGCYRV